MVYSPRPFYHFCASAIYFDKDSFFYGGALVPIVNGITTRLSVPPLNYRRALVNSLLQTISDQRVRYLINLLIVLRMARHHPRILIRRLFVNNFVKILHVISCFLWSKLSKPRTYAYRYTASHVVSFLLYFNMSVVSTWVSSGDFDTTTSISKSGSQLDDSLDFSLGAWGTSKAATFAIWPGTHLQECSTAKVPRRLTDSIVFFFSIKSAQECGQHIFSFKFLFVCVPSFYGQNVENIPWEQAMNKGTCYLFKAYHADSLLIAIWSAHS